MVLEKNRKGNNLRTNPIGIKTKSPNIAADACQVMELKKQSIRLEIKRVSPKTKSNLPMRSVVFAFIFLLPVLNKYSHKKTARSSDSLYL